MKYTISYQKAHQHFIDISCRIEGVNSETLDVHLPAWRPGRYELGNFAKNIQKWVVTDEMGTKLPSRKITKDHWVIQTKGCKTIRVNYNYYASELNAGSTYLDEKQLFINPVNCLIYVKERMDEEHILELKLPEGYIVATNLSPCPSPKERGVNSAASTSVIREDEKEEHVVFTAKNFDELADSPLMAGNTLKRNFFVYEGIEFNLWFQGECTVDWGKLIGDFFIFVNEQYEMFKEFPSPEYHFLFQILPNKFHHGVEHLNSTAIALGPGNNLMSGASYDELLGISSHELFHTWNIKSIRPVEMMPYDYSRENYTNLGYVAEGVTTYYGDLMLFRSRIFTDFDYSKKFSESVQRHFDNFGRLHRSLAESSFDTWLDGYGKAIPDRVMSIYPDGCLLAFMTDILIRKNSENRFSLDDVMRKLYYEFAKKGKGYSEDDYKMLIEEAAGKTMDEFFREYVWGTSPFEPLFKECLGYIGCELISNRSRKFYEAFWGIKTNPSSTGKGETIASVYPGSDADNAGLWVNDEILAINELFLKNDLAEWSRHFSFRPVNLLVRRQHQTMEIKFTPTKEVFYRIYFINKLDNPSGQQKLNFERWSGRKF